MALGGGHGLFASLSALRLLDVDITAIVTVADDGGSSGRIRRELGTLPPGDLRMALAALSSEQVGTGPLRWDDVLQHRMGGVGALAGHPIGNLLLTGLMELHQDPVSALDDLAQTVGAAGRVLPMCPRPLDLIADVDSTDPDDPVRSRRIRGQSAIAATPGRVTSIELVPPDAAACPQAVAAIDAADAVLLGPGSWFTSVIPHLLVPELADALQRTAARRVIIVNLEPQVGETDGFSPEEHISSLRQYCPKLPIDAVIADQPAVADPTALRRFTDSLSAELVLSAVAADGAEARHDPTKLSLAIARAVGLDSYARQ
ncbi:MAG: uridine diphosphate-N-acetylglucosamine-binding protein YvcK [Frankiales bacterium]|nr:uridine diphosphate-N-acetylglucosamine-binding protein YvcK [Frankiales bacterium]